MTAVRKVTQNLCRVSHALLSLTFYWLVATTYLLIMEYSFKEEVPHKISKDQVPLKIHSKVGAFKNIIMEIPLQASATENV